MKKGIVYALLTAILFVTLEPVSKLIADDVNPYAITFWRFIIGALIMVPLAVSKIKKEKIHIGPKDFGIMSAMGILVVCFSMIALQIGVKKADSPSLIAIVFSANSVITILLAVFFLKEKLHKNTVIALLLGIIGVVVCADFSSGTNLESILYTVFAAVSFSLYTVLSQKYTKKFGGVIQISIVFLVGSIVLLVALLILGVDISVPYDAASVANLLYLGIMVTGIGYLCYFKAIEKGGAIMASLAFFIKPVLTPFVTLVVNGIELDIKVFIAAALIVAASYFATYKKK